MATRLQRWLSWLTVVEYDHTALKVGDTWLLPPGAETEVVRQAGIPFVVCKYMPLVRRVRWRWQPR